MTDSKNQNKNQSKIEAKHDNGPSNFFISLEGPQISNRSEVQKSNSMKENMIDSQPISSEKAKIESSQQNFQIDMEYQVEKSKKQEQNTENLKASSAQFDKIMRLKQKNKKFQKLKSRLNFFVLNGELQEPIFSKSSALEKLVSKKIIMPDAQCLGCVKFFYKEIPYDFKASEQKKYVINTLTAHNKSRLLTYINALYNQRRQGYIFVTEVLSTSSGTKILGLDKKFDVFNLIIIIKKAIRQFTYQIGQRYITTKNYEINLIPVIQKEQIQYFNQENNENICFDDLALRVKFNPFPKQAYQLSENKDKIRDMRKGSHWPIQCEHPIFFEQHLLKKQKLKIESQIAQKSKITLLKYNEAKKNKKGQQLLEKIEKLKINSGIFKLCRSIISQDIKSQWIVVQHNCPHSLIQKLVGKIYPGDIFQTKTSKYLIVYDESFCLSETYTRFTNAFQEFISVDYVVFNIRQGMRLSNKITEPTHLIFEELYAAIVAYFLLQNLNIGRVQFASRSKMLSQSWTDEEHYYPKKKNKVKRRSQ